MIFGDTFLGVDTTFSPLGTPCAPQLPAVGSCAIINMEAPTWGVFNEEHSPGKATRQATSWVVFKNTGENFRGVQKHVGKREINL